MPTITIRLSDEQKDYLESAAQRAGQSLSEYIRQALELQDYNALDRIGRLERDVQALRELASVQALRELAGL